MRLPVCKYMSIYIYIWRRPPWTPTNSYLFKTTLKAHNQLDKLENSSRSCCVYLALSYPYNIYAICYDTKSRQSRNASEPFLKNSKGRGSMRPSTQNLCFPNEVPRLGRSRREGSQHRTWQHCGAPPSHSTLKRQLQHKKVSMYKCLGWAWRR